MHDTNHVMVSEAESSSVELSTHRQIATLSGLQARYGYLHPCGARSIALQKLFDRVIGDLDVYSDRLSQLTAAFSSFGEEPVEKSQSDSFTKDRGCIFEDKIPIFDISAALSAFGESVRAAIDDNVVSGDFTKAKFFIGVLHDIDEQLSAVESQLTLK